MANLKGWLKRKEELIPVIIIGIVMFFLLVLNSEFVISTYDKDNINQTILNFSGTLFGLLLTAYAILFGLIPALSKEALETKALESVNFRFLFSLILSILITAISFLIVFTQDLIKIFLIYVQIALLIALLLITPLLILYLYYLFQASKS